MNRLVVDETIIGIPFGSGHRHHLHKPLLLGTFGCRVMVTPLLTPRIDHWFLPRLKAFPFKIGIKGKRHQSVDEVNHRGTRTVGDKQGFPRRNLRQTLRVAKERCIAPAPTVNRLFRIPHIEESAILFGGQLMRHPRENLPLTHTRILEFVNHQMANRVIQTVGNVEGIGVANR